MAFYRILSILALAGYAPYALLKSLTGRRRLGDIRGRLGKSPYPDLAGGVWIHAVSVGEVGVARTLLAAMGRRAPEVSFGLSTTTAAGRELAERSAGDRAGVFAFPFDLAGPVETALSSVRPGLVLLTETEIWPLFLERTARRAIPVALVNGRVSARSFERYRLVRSFLREALTKIDLFAMQTEPDAARIAELGAPRDRIHVTGNLKYDLPETPLFPDAERLKETSSGRPVLVAASTGEGEEEALLRAWRPFASRSLLVLAPRRPERFDFVASLVEREGFRVVRRSHSVGVVDLDVPITRSPDHPIARSPVYLLDTIGELASLYREAMLAFVGGSLAPVGGHNPIEAWAQGVPVITGPHMENFREIAEHGERNGFLTRIGDAGDLAARLEAWLADPGSVRDGSERARKFVLDNRGAAEKTVELVLPLLRRSGAGRRAAP